MKHLEVLGDRAEGTRAAGFLQSYSDCIGVPIHVSCG